MLLEMFSSIMREVLLWLQLCDENTSEKEKFDDEREKFMKIKKIKFDGK